MNWMQDVMDAKKRGVVYPGDQKQEGASMSNIDIEYKLVEKIKAELGIRPFESGPVIEYLNRHGWLRDPDLVPGRTITESEYERLVEYCHDMYGVARGPLRAFGSHFVTVVPDPEPTNAQKWETFCKRLHIDLTPWQIDYLVAAMDERGVKAPEERR